MKTNRLIWTLGWVTMSSLAAMQGCGGDDDDEGTGGTSGTSGGAGEGGTDTGGTGGNTGGTGTGGRGGTATGGTAGSTTGGTSGAGGAPEGGMGGEGGNGEGGSGTPPNERALVCEDYCESYYASMCDTFTTNTYDSISTCRSTCEGAPWLTGDAGDAMGNSAHCRLTHANLAAGGDEVHCGHASADSTGNCVP